MSKKTLPEIIEENKKILRKEYERGYLVGFKEAENRTIGELLNVLEALKKHANHNKNPFSNLAWVRNAIKSEIKIYKKRRT